MIYKKFINKSIRLKSWDYSTPWWYFITICTCDRINYFGKIDNGKVILSEIGAIVNEEWINTELLRDYVELDEFVIMPNHFHGVIIINENNNACHGRQQLYGSVTRKCNRQNLQFKWQPKFHDRIIRNEKEFFNIRNYIKENPLKYDLNFKIENVNTS
ncbi:MAG: transposase [Melioribacteraceae bacterium]|nr:transposase [Melioribacteraceae bacterium]